MTPTEQEIEFFTSEKAKRIQELWEPKEGDWAKTRHDGIQVLKTDDDSRYLVWHIGRTYPDLEEVTYLSGGYAKEIKKDCVWLPRQGQLQAMLEERGYGLAHLGDERLHPDFDGRDWNPDEPYQAIAQKEPGDYVKAIAPTPSIALGKCLLEVLKGGESDE